MAQEARQGTAQIDQPKVVRQPIATVAPDDGGHPFRSEAVGRGRSVRTGAFARRYAARLELVIPAVILGANLLAQTHNLGQFMDTTSDEGVYLYSARLILAGYLPYRDFFLAHPPFALYEVALLFWASARNVTVFHLVYTTLIFSSLFPLYFVARKLTGSRLAAVVSLTAFSTFPELVHEDARLFALRPFSLPILAFAWYFLYVAERRKIAGLLLGAFSLCVVSNLAIAGAFLAVLLGSEMVSGRQGPIGVLRRQRALWLPWLVVVAGGYLLAAVIPRFVEDAWLFQLARPSTPYWARVDSFWTRTWPQNWPILALGVACPLIAGSRARLFGFANALTLAIVLLGANSYYAHYLDALAPGLALGCGLFCAGFARFHLSRVVVVLGVLALLVGIPRDFLRGWVIEETTPAFFTRVEALRSAPEPLLTFEPTFAVYADKTVTFYYYAADSRGPSVLRQNPDMATFSDLLSRSNSVLLERSPGVPNFSLYPENRSYLAAHFRLFFSDGDDDIYVRDKG
jgi:hypothetical protein